MALAGCYRTLHVSLPDSSVRDFSELRPLSSRNKLRKTENAVEEWRNKIDMSKAEPYGFASLACAPYAHIVARLLADKHPKGTIITLAPPPKDIVSPYPA